MPARSVLPFVGRLALGVVAVFGAGLFIAGDLVGPRALRPAGGILALGGYAALLILRRPPVPGTRVNAAPGQEEARHVA